MKSISIPGFIHAKPLMRWEKPDSSVQGMGFSFWTFDDMKDQGYVPVCPYTVTFDLPEGWDPRPGQIEALEAKKDALQREFTKAVVAINAQISRLQAIDYTPEPAAADLDDDYPF